MKKSINILLILCLFLLTACERTEEDIGEVGLYPAYELEKNNKLWGYIDKKGEFIVAAKYDTVKDYSNGIALVEKNGLFGVIDRNGKEVLKPEYTNINKIENGYMIAFKDKSVKIFDYEGKEVNLSKEYRNIGVFSDDLFNVLILDKDGEMKFGYVNKLGEEVIEPKYEVAYSFHLGRAIVKDGGKFKVIDKKGSEFKTLEYEDIKPSNKIGTYIYSSKGDNFGLLNKDGDIIVEAKYSAIVDIENDLVVVGEIDEEVELFGLIDINGKEILKPIYNDIKLLGEGYVAVSKETGLAGENMYKILNQKLEEISEEAYYNVGGRLGKLENGIISVSTGLETYGLDLDGEIVENIPITLGYGEVYTDGNIVRIVVDGEILYYNMKDEIIWEANYTYTIDDREVVRKEYGRDDKINIRYPYFVGFKDKEVQESINSKILEEFTLDNRTKDEIKSSDYKYYKTTYSINRLGDILEIEKLDKRLRKNDIQEDVNKEVYNIDLQNGYFYILEDIFKKDSGFIGAINEALLKQTTNEIVNIGLDKLEDIREDSSFKVEDNKLCLYLKYDEIHEIIKGYEKIEVDLKDLDEILDLNAEFFVKRLD